LLHVFVLFNVLVALLLLTELQCVMSSEMLSFLQGVRFSPPIYSYSVYDW